jgi:hypothetical protein
MGADLYGTAAAIGWQVGTAVGNAVRHKGRPHGPGANLKLSKNQQLFNQSTQNILEMEQMAIANAASQGNIVNEAVYKMLGYQPRYSNDAPDPAALKASANQAFSDSVTAYNTFKQAKKTYERAKAAAGDSHGTNWAKVAATGGMTGYAKGQPKARAAAAAMRDMKLASDRLDMARSAYASQRDSYQSALNNPRQIIGLDPIGPDPTTGVRAGHDPKNPDDLMQIALDVGNESLLRALKGEEPIDQTLVHAYDVGEINLRERLRRQLGPDYETSTAGSQAINDFIRTKGEAFQQFNRQTIQLYSTMTQQEAQTLTNLTGTKIAQLLSPMDTSLKIAGALGSSADQRNAYTTMNRNWLAQKAGLGVQSYNAATSAQQAATNASELQTVQNNQLANVVGGGLVSGSESLSRYLGQQDTANTWAKADIGTQRGDYGA